MVEPRESSKEEFLESVRRALGRSSSAGPQPPYPHLEESLAQLEAQAQEVQQRLEHSRSGLVDRLAETAQLRGWNVRRASNPEGTLEYIGSVAAGLGVKKVVRSDQEVFRELSIDAALQSRGISVTTIARDEGRSRESLREEIIAAGLGITGADYAVAETGSVVVLPRRGLSRLVSLVPPVHLALVRPQDVVGDLDDVFLLRRLDYYRNGGDMGSYLNFITGPSRTADIEQTLVVGVHGPKEVHLVLLG
jgi:L-lactate dehydrogenase complex protein LldG